MTDYLNNKTDFLSAEKISGYVGQLTDVVGNYDAMLGALKNSKENPFNTAYGQEVVSISESAVKRLVREATTVKYGATTDQVNLTNTNPAGKIYTPAAGFNMYCINATGSATVDCLIAFGVDNNAGNNLRIVKRAFLKAGTEFNYKADGELFASATAGDVLKFYLIPTASGTFYASFYGVEIAEND